MTAALLPQVMNPAIRLGHCHGCGATTYVTPVQMRRATDTPPFVGDVVLRAGFLCAGCVETHLEDGDRERRAQVRALQGDAQ